MTGVFLTENGDLIILSKVTKVINGIGGKRHYDVFTGDVSPTAIPEKDLAGLMAALEEFYAPLWEIREDWNIGEDGAIRGGRVNGMSRKKQG